LSARIEAFLRGQVDEALAPRSGDPLRQPHWFIPDLPSRPFYESRTFPWTARLEEHSPAILEELEALQRGRPADWHKTHDWLVERGAWRTFPLYDRGARDEAVARACPVTTQLVESIPGATSAGLAYFSAMEPRTRIRPHCGPTNSRLRCHLGLSVPEGCELRVGSETRRWQQGRCLVFDDAYEHEAHNPTDEWRVVLLVDVWHPELAAQERAALTSFFDQQASKAATAASLGPTQGPGALAAFAGIPASIRRGDQRFQLQPSSSGWRSLRCNASRRR